MRKKSLHERRPFAKLIFSIALVASCRMGSDARSPSELAASRVVAANLHCLEDHLREAMALNKERRPRYAQASASASLVISDKLIQAEESLLSLTSSFRPWLQYWWDKGVPVTCLEFSPMSEVAPYSDKFLTPAPKVTEVPWIDDGDVAWKLQKALLGEGFSGVLKTALAAIRQLEHPKHYQCMSLHMLESIAKTAQVGMQLQAQSEKLGIASSAPVTYALIQGQIFHLDEAKDLDKASFKLHQDGLPIICNDIPSIPIVEP